jgi:hypothetical protein
MGGGGAMRYRFRAWDNVADEMLYAGEDTDVIFVLGSAGIECTDVRNGSPSGDGIDSMEHLIYMQWTGLTDRNGKEIYEGDKLLIDGEQELDYGFSFEWNEHAVVRWNDEECGFHLDVIRKREVILDEDACFIVDTFPLRKWSEGEWGIEYEIIGNIFENNPELINS